MTTPQQELLAVQDGPALRITLNRPEEGNGFTDTMAQQFIQAVRSAHESSDFILLCGAGADFCTGRVRTPGAPPLSLEAYTRRDEYELIFDCYDAVRSSPLPVVGAFQGRSMGVGTALAALCDVSLAADTATFSIPELGHNILPTMVLSAIFDRLNRNAISWMTYSQMPVTAAEALAYGLVGSVVPEEQLAGELAKLCQKLAGTPRPALRAVKEYLRSAPEMPAKGAVDYARSLHAMVNTAVAMKRKVP
jgi:enoyl-CoA hydratase